MIEDAALPLILMAVGAVAMPSLARSAGVPVAIAEIAYGVLIGRSGLGIAGDPDNPFTRFLADFGFAFFLFLAGMEVDFRELERGGRRTVAVPFVLSCVSFGLALGAARLLGWSHWVALAAGATSVPLLLAVVREVGLGSTPLGARMITAAAVGELVTVALLSLAEIHAHAQDLVHALLALARVTMLGVAVVLGITLLRALLWWFPAPFIRMVAHDDPNEIGVRVGFGVMLVMVGLARFAGIEPLLGAFLGGLMLGYVVRRKGALEHKLSSMAYGFFVPAFFIHVGMRLDLRLETLTGHGRLIAEVVVAMFVVKLIPQLSGLFAGQRFRDVVGGALLLAAPLTLVIAVMDIGARVGAVDPQMEAAVITAGIAASLLYPSIARRLLVRRAP